MIEDCDDTEDRLLAARGTESTFFITSLREHILYCVMTGHVQLGVPLGLHAPHGAN